MGTSGAYGGSPGKAWSLARRRARRLPDQPQQQDIDWVLSAVGQGMGFDGDGGDVGQPPGGDQAPEGNRPAADNAPHVSWGPISASRPSGAGGGGGGAGGGRAGRRPPGGGATPRTRRSVRRAGAVGARAARATNALLTGNARILAEFGLRLEELVGLSAPEQAHRIAAQLGVSDTVENAEILKAADKLILAQLAQGGALTPVELGRLFATFVIDEVMATELGAVFNDGSRSREWVRDTERIVHDAVKACVDGIVVDGAGTLDTEQVIVQVLSRAQAVYNRRRATR